MCMWHSSSNSRDEQWHVPLPSLFMVGMSSKYCKKSACERKYCWAHTVKKSSATIMLITLGKVMSLHYCIFPSMT
jgi:hypothetical protein